VEEYVKDVAEYAAKCYTCQQVKAEHKRPAGTLQPLPILERKWEQISMDFIVGLRRTRKGNDLIWVIIDGLTKLTHFLSVNTNYTLEMLGKIYVREIVKLHGVSVSIVSN